MNPRQPGFDNLFITANNLVVNVNALKVSEARTAVGVNHRAGLYRLIDEVLRIFLRFRGDDYFSETSFGLGLASVGEPVLGLDGDKNLLLGAGFPPDERRAVELDLAFELVGVAPKPRCRACPP